MTLLSDIFLAFLSGANFLVSILYYIGFNSLKKQYKLKNMKKIFSIDPYFFYTLIQPLYMGLMSILAVLLLHNMLKINIRISYLIISIISFTLVSIFIRYFDIYKWTENRYIRQYIILFLLHSFIYNIVIANIYIYLKNK